MKREMFLTNPRIQERQDEILGTVYDVYNGDTLVISWLQKGGAEEFIRVNDGRHLSLSAKQPTNKGR